MATRKLRLQACARAIPSACCSLPCHGPGELLHYQRGPSGDVPGPGSLPGFPQPQHPTLQKWGRPSGRVSPSLGAALRPARVRLPPFPRDGRSPPCPRSQIRPGRYRQETSWQDRKRRHGRPPRPSAIRALFWELLYKPGLGAGQPRGRGDAGTRGHVSSPDSSWASVSPLHPDLERTGPG
jgi:hypothetical protein